MTTLAQWIALERTYSWPARWERLKEWAAIKVAWRLLPKRVRMWVIYRAAADATSGKWGNVHPGEVLAFELIDRMK